MKELVYKPMNTGDGVIVQYTDSFILDKGMKISVPNQYIAVVFDNEKISFRVEPCVGKVIFKEYGKNFLGHTMKIAFIHVTAIPEMPWGFGNIQVNNERLKEAYRVGTNGAFQIKITDFTKLMSAFSGSGEITVDDVKEKVLSLIKTIGVELVGACFANTDVSVFEISSLVGKIREDLFEKLSKESKLADMGIKIANLTVAGVHVNEEDLELIRDRINGSEDTESDDDDDSDDDGETVKLREDIEKFQTEILKKMSEEIAAAEARSKDASERKITEQIENNRRATVSTVMQYINEQLDEFGKSLSSELDEKIQEMLPLRDGAQESTVDSLTLTAENIISNATTDDDYVPAAAMIYSNVEDNLIHKFGLMHENEKFLIDFRDYMKIAERARIGNRYLLKKRNDNGSFTTFMPRVYKGNDNGEPSVVESLPIVRFMQAGLNAEDAWYASEIWTTLNRIRHKSDENKAKLNAFFTKEGTTQKEYLLSALEFYKENGLYTKD